MRTRGSRSLWLWVALPALACFLTLFERARRKQGAEPSGSTPAAEPRAVPPQGEEPHAPEREVLVGAENEGLALRLELVRFPDGAPLARVAVRVEPSPAGSTDGWLLTSPEGQLSVSVPRGTDAMRLAANGYQPADAALGAERDLRIALTPLTGLFGRVVDAEGGAPGVEVQRVDRLWRVAPTRADQNSPYAAVSTLDRVVGSTRTNEAGYYYLPSANETGMGRVRARSGARAGEVEFLLPRAAVPLDDIVLNAVDALTVRVVDPDGRGVARASVRSPENPLPRDDSLTDEDGILVIPSPTLPARFGATAEGLRLTELRLDGLVVDHDATVDSARTRVELVLAPVASVRARVVDADTGSALFAAQGTVLLSSAGVELDQATFRADSKGEALLALAPRDFDTRTPDLATVTISADAYLEEQTFELDIRSLRDDETVVLALEPAPGTLCLRGRALRAEAPVGGLEVGIRIQSASGGARPASWQFTRARTDADGRFSARWAHEYPDEVVTAFPHAGSSEEYGFIGPMSVGEAIAREHVLELAPPVLVPAVLRGVSADVDYRYFVSVVDGDVVVDASTNGVPLGPMGAGEVRTTLSLPARNRVRVMIGVVTGNQVIRDRDSAVEHDPTHPALPLVFDVRCAVASLRGEVVGFATGEIASLRVGFVRKGDVQGGFVRPALDGTFRLTHVSHGEGELYLVREGSAVQSEVLSQLPLVVTGDIDGVALYVDPTSLPETPGAR